MIWVSIIIAFIILCIGSWTDIKKREVHDYLSYGLIFVAFGISIIYSIIDWTYVPLINSAIGFIIGLVIAYGMFYLGQWGGGDSKLIMGLGAVFGFNVFAIFGQNNYWLIILLVNIIFAGAIYGLIWSIYLAIKHRTRFMERVKAWSDKKNITFARRLLLGFTILCVLLILLFVPQEFKLIFLAFIAVIFVIFYMWIFVKIIEESCMIKDIQVSKLTEGDWVYKNVYAGKKLITGPKDLGISRQQIAALKKHGIKKITIKEGIPFIPAFLIAYIVTIIMYMTHVIGLFGIL